MNDQLKIFITGADGMLGSSICRELLSRGYSVKALIFPGSKSIVLHGLAIETVEGDVLDKEFLLREMKDCKRVIHAAALTTVWPRKSPRVMKVNLEGTRNVMEVASMLKLELMIHVGTANSFGCGSRENPADETNTFDGWKYGMDYMTSKYLAQKMLLENYSQTGFPVKIINPTYMIGPFDSGPSSGKMLLELMKDKLPGYSGGSKNFVCSTDVAVAIVNALTLGRTGECYIAGNENLDYKTFFSKACKTRNKKFNLIKVPDPLILAIGFFNSVLARITGRPPKLSYSMARMACINQAYSSKKAQQELDMPQTPIENAIDQCLGWFEKNGYLK